MHRMARLKLDIGGACRLCARAATQHGEFPLAASLVRFKLPDIFRHETEWVNWQPHFHARVICGAFTEAGEFPAPTACDAQALLHAGEEAVHALFLRLGKIEPGMRKAPHSQPSPPPKPPFPTSRLS